jgi:hypothetical protein
MTEGRWSKERRLGHRGQITYRETGRESIKSAMAIVIDAGALHMVVVDDELAIAGIGNSEAKMYFLHTYIDSKKPRLRRRLNLGQFFAAVSLSHH